MEQRESERSRTTLWQTSADSLDVAIVIYHIYMRHSVRQTPYSFELLVCLARGLHWPSSFIPSQSRGRLYRVIKPVDLIGFDGGGKNSS